MARPGPAAPAGIDGSLLPGPFAVGHYAARMREYLRARTQVQLFGEVWNLRVSAVPRRSSRHVLARRPGSRLGVAQLAATASVRGLRAVHRHGGLGGVHQGLREMRASGRRRASGEQARLARRALVLERKARAAALDARRATGLQAIAMALPPTTPIAPCGVATRSSATGRVTW